MPDAAERSRQYADRYISYLQELGQNPSSCGVLTVRCLLSAQQHFLREFGFGDAFCHQKKVRSLGYIHVLDLLHYFPTLKCISRFFARLEISVENFEVRVDTLSKLDSLEISLFIAPSQDQVGNKAKCKMMNFSCGHSHPFLDLCMRV